MSTVTQIYNLDIVPNGVDVVVKCSQYDKESRTIQFNLFENSQPYSSANITSASVRGTKADNTGFEYPCTVESPNIVKFNIQDQMTVFNGKVLCEIRLLNGSDILGTANFILFVERTSLSDDIVISETDLPLLEEAEQNAMRAEAAADSVSAIVPSNVGSDGQVLTKDGDGAIWQDASGGGQWGEITGTLSNQTDLQNALNAAGQSAAWGSITGTLSNQTDINTALNNRVLKAGDSMSGNLTFGQNVGLKGLDRENNEYFMMKDNHSNLWIGASQTNSKHHVGNTYISTGYNPSTSLGYASIQVSVPNETNTNAANYNVLHEGYIPIKSSTSFTYQNGCSAWASSGANKPIAEKRAGIVQLSGAIKFASTAQSAAGPIIIGSVPVGYEPNTVFRFVSQGSGQNRFYIIINTDGTIEIQRYGIDTNIPIPAGAFFNIGCTYIAKTL